jgi:hypothetical protein
MPGAATLLRPREHIVRALAKELLVRRSMTGDEVIAAAISMKSIEDECQHRRAWKRIEQSAALFVADDQA